jgi:hypothetical protein
MDWSAASEASRSRRPRRDVCHSQKQVALYPLLPGARRTQTQGSSEASGSTGVDRCALNAWAYRHRSASLPVQEDMQD